MPLLYIKVKQSVAIFSYSPMHARPRKSKFNLLVEDSGYKISTVLNDYFRTGYRSLKADRLVLYFSFVLINDFVASRGENG